MTRELLFTLPIGIYHASGWFTGRKREFKKTADGMNAPDNVIDVPVMLDPDLDTRGLCDRAAGMPVIVLREWSLQVLIHEITHAALDHLVWKFDGTVEDLFGEHNHEMVMAIEVALAPIIHTLAAEDAARSAAQHVSPSTADSHRAAQERLVQETFKEKGFEGFVQVRSPEGIPVTLHEGRGVVTDKTVEQVIWACRYASPSTLAEHVRAALSAALTEDGAE